MAIYTSTPANEVQEVQWLHWLFVREGHMLSCDVDVRGDGLYRVSLFPLWAPEDVVTQSFQRPAEAQSSGRCRSTLPEVSERGAWNQFMITAHALATISLGRGKIATPLDSCSAQNRCRT